MVVVDLWLERRSDNNWPNSEEGRIFEDLFLKPRAISNDKTNSM